MPIKNRVASRHLALATSLCCRQVELRCAGLLGTRWTFRRRTIRPARRSCARRRGGAARDGVLRGEVLGVGGQAGVANQQCAQALECPVWHPLTGRSPGGSYGTPSRAHQPAGSGGLLGVRWAFHLRDARTCRVADLASRTTCAAPLDQLEPVEGVGPRGRARIGSTPNRIRRTRCPGSPVTNPTASHDSAHAGSYSRSSTAITSAGVGFTPPILPPGTPY
jgi:hypothetical protein